MPPNPFQRETVDVAGDLGRFTDIASTLASTRQRAKEFATSEKLAKGQFAIQAKEGGIDPETLAVTGPSLSQQEQQLKVGQLPVYQQPVSRTRALKMQGMFNQLGIKSGFESITNTITNAAKTGKTNAVLYRETKESWPVLQNELIEGLMQASNKVPESQKEPYFKVITELENDTDGAIIDTVFSKTIEQLQAAEAAEAAEKVQDEELVKVSPGGALFDPETGKLVFQAPFQPQTEAGKIAADLQANLVDEGQAAEALSRLDKVEGDATELRKEFTQISKTFNDQTASFGRVVESGKDPSAAGDLALIFNYMKILDPGSVVRESEFATASNTAGVPDRIRNIYNRLLEGERLAVDQRKDFIDRAGRLYGDAQKSHESIRSQFSGVVERSGLKPEETIIDFRRPDLIVDFEKLVRGKIIAKKKDVSTTTEQASKAAQGTVLNFDAQGNLIQ